MDIKNFKRVYLDDCNCVAWDIDPTVNSEKGWSNKVDLSPDLDIFEQENLYLLFAYPKNVQEDLNPEQKKAIKKMIDAIRKE